MSAGIGGPVYIGDAVYVEGGAFVGELRLYTERPSDAGVSAVVHEIYLEPPAFEELLLAAGRDPKLRERIVRVAARFAVEVRT